MSDALDGRAELLAFTPERYLADGFCDSDGLPRATLTGEAASAAATQLVQAELSSQELAFTYEALGIMLERTEGTPAARASQALAAALGTVARMIRQPNNEGLEEWCRSCVQAIRAEADITALLAHIQATLRLHALMTGLPSPAELAELSSLDSPS